MSFFLEPGANSGDEEEEESGITLVDVVEEEEQLEEDANAVLGASDADNCTYTAVRLPQSSPTSNANDV